MKRMGQKQENKWTFLVPILVVFCLYISCRRDDTPLFVSSKSAMQIVSKPGQKIEFIFEGESAVAIDRFVVRSKPTSKPTQIILDSALSFPAKKIRIEYYYTVPELTDTIAYDLSFDFYDRDGNTFTLLRQVVSLPESYLLQETSGHILYARARDINKSGFNFKSKSNVVFDSLSYLKMDMYDTSSTLVLSRVLHAKTGGRFVKFNAFDYAKATNITIKKAFDAAASVDYLGILSLDDIILFHNTLDPTFYAVFRVQAVDSSRFIFNLKTTR